MYNHLKYLSCFFFPGCVVWFLYTGPHDATGALVWTIPLWSLVAFDWLSPKINSKEKKRIVSRWFYDAILYALSFLQFLIIALLLIYASQLQWDSIHEIVTSIVNLIVMRILVGTTSGSSAIIVAHELIHRSEVHMRLLGKLLLFSVCYEHFVIAHMRGHHLSVATPQDIATARLGESFESYWKRVYVGHFKYAWNSELERLNLQQVPVYHYKMLANSVLQGMIIEFTLVVLILVFFGWAAMFIFLYQALTGVRLLETINYYQHWGLEQGRAGNTLAWVNQSSLTEYALVGLSNHIAHHQNAAKSFQEIPYSDQGPKMPYGYFVTNLWVKLHNESYRRISTRVLKNYLMCKT
jgi:alkane 1-monooxygenase